MTSRKSREAILECLEYVISLFPDNNRGYNLSRTYRKALKEYLRENSMNHERKKNTIAEKITASEGKNKNGKQKPVEAEQGNGENQEGTS